MKPNRTIATRLGAVSFRGADSVWMEKSGTKESKKPSPWGLTENASDRASPERSDTAVVTEDSKLPLFSSFRGMLTDANSV